MATIVLDKNFEDNSLSGITPTGNPLTIITSPVATGSRALRFYLDRTLPTNYRTECTFGGVGQNADQQEFWLGFNFMYQNWGADNILEAAPFQFHPPNAPECGGNVKPLFELSPLFMITNNGRTYFQGNLQTYYSFPTVSNKWYSIVVMLKDSNTSSGRVWAWVDGVQRINYSGKTHEATTRCGTASPNPNYLKMGIYKPPWKTATSLVSSRTIIIDNLKIAKGTDGFNDVNPPSIGGGGIDTTAPVISAISESGIGISTATINFTTDEASTTIINYGPTTSYGTTYTSASLVTSHSASLTGLLANTIYNYQIRSADAAGNIKTQANRTFVTLVDESTIAPIITNVVATPTDDDATITWDTNEASSSRVLFSWEVGNVFSVFDASLIFAHSITASTESALPPATLINYKASSVDADGNQTDFFGTFTTDELAVPVLRITDAVITLIDNYINVTWVTNKDATSVVTLNGLNYKTAGLSLTHSVNASRVKIGDNTLIITSVTDGAAETLTQDITFTVNASIA